MSRLKGFLILIAVSLSIGVSASKSLGGCIEDTELEHFSAEPDFNWGPPWEDLLTGQMIPLSRKPPQGFLQNRTATVLESTLLELPKGLSASENIFFGRIFEYLRNVDFIYRDLKELEKRTAEVRPSKDTILNILKDRETFFGLSAVDVNHALSIEELLELLGHGGVLMDHEGAHLQMTAELGQKNPEDRSPRIGWKHAVLSHRLQAFLVMGDYLRCPELYGFDLGSSSSIAEYFSEMYKKLGSLTLAKNLDWSDSFSFPNSGDATGRLLFVELFDSVENNGSNPGFYLNYSGRYWKGLPLW